MSDNPRPNEEAYYRAYDHADRIAQGKLKDAEKQAHHHVKNLLDSDSPLENEDFARVLAEATSWLALEQEVRKYICAYTRNYQALYSEEGDDAHHSAMKFATKASKMLQLEDNCKMTYETKFSVDYNYLIEELPHWSLVYKKAELVRDTEGYMKTMGLKAYKQAFVHAFDVAFGE